MSETRPTETEAWKDFPEAHAEANPALMLSMLKALSSGPLLRGELFSATREAHLAAARPSRRQPLHPEDFEQVFRGARAAGLITWREDQVRDAASHLAIVYELSPAGARYLAEVRSSYPEAASVSGVAVAAILLIAALLAALAIARLVIFSMGAS